MLSFICRNSPCMWCVKAFAQVFFVEPHRWDNTLSNPVDHNVGKQIVQGEFPETHSANIPMLLAEC